MDYIVDELTDMIEDYDDIVNTICADLTTVYFLTFSLNICLQLQKFQFDWVPFDWLDPCRFNKNTFLTPLETVEDGMDWVNLNFQIFDLFFELYINSS